MKYILREINSEEEFIKTFGQDPKWIFSPLRITTGAETEEESKVISEHPGDRLKGKVSDDQTNLKT